MRTSESTYDDDVQAATALTARFIDLDSAHGNMRNWIGDALNNEWVEGLTIERWVARALVRIKHGQ